MTTHPTQDADESPAVEDHCPICGEYEVECACDEDADEDRDINGADLIDFLALHHPALWQDIRRAFLHGGQIVPDLAPGGHWGDE